MSEQHVKTYRPWEPQRTNTRRRAPRRSCPRETWCLPADMVLRVDLRRFYAPDEQETLWAPRSIQP